MSLKTTSLNEWHRANGGRMIDFGGWDMPVSFAGLRDEHKQVRSSVGLFDVSHMGEVRLRGPGALDAVQRLVSNDVSVLVDGQAQYTVMCNHRGGIVDDLIVYRFSDTDVMLCVNAANRTKDFDWIVTHNPHADVAVTDEGDDWAQIAVQGRNAVATLTQEASIDVGSIGPYHFAPCAYAGIEGCIAARTGYTGEDGFELFVPTAHAEAAWTQLMASGEGFGIQPIGLGARDTLRLEACFRLYGNDMNDDTTPFEAGLGWVTKLRKETPFIGQEALRAQRRAGVPRRLAALIVDKRIPRPHCSILHDGEVVGEVTSGTRSPSLESSVALGYVPTVLCKPGASVQIDVRGRLAEAQVVRPPFYSRDY